MGLNTFHQNRVSGIAVKLIQGLILNDFRITLEEIEKLKNLVLPTKEVAPTSSSRIQPRAKGLPTSEQLQKAYRDLLVGCTLTYLLPNFELEGYARYAAAEEYLNKALSQSQAASHGREGQSLITEIAFISTGFNHMNRTLNTGDIKSHPFVLIDIYRALFKLVELPKEMEARFADIQGKLTPDDEWSKVEKSDQEWMNSIKEKAERFIHKAASAEPDLQRGLVQMTAVDNLYAEKKLKTDLRNIISNGTNEPSTRSYASALRVDLKGREAQNFNEIDTALRDSQTAPVVIATICEGLLKIIAVDRARVYMGYVKEKAAEFNKAPTSKPPLTETEYNWLDKVRRWAVEFSDQILKREQGDYAFQALKEGRLMDPIPDAFYNVRNDARRSFTNSNGPTSIPGPQQPTR